MAIISTFRAVTNSLDVGITESSSDRGGARGGDLTSTVVL